MTNRVSVVILARMTNPLWMVRAGRGGVYVQDFVDDGYVAIGFSDDVGELPAGITKDKLVERFRKAHPERKTPKLLNAASQVFRFHDELSLGDEVVTYDPGRRRYFVGRIDSEVRYEPGPADGLHYRRKVSWRQRVPRDLLKPATRNTLGSTLTLFRPNDDAASDLRQRAVAIDAPESEEPQAAPSADEEAALEEIQGSMEEKSREFIADVIAALDPSEMEDLIAGILRAMGYKSRRSPTGPDRGVDIFASPDGLGLEEPRIFVEVKHRPKTTMSAGDLRSFLGGRQPGDKCLYVSTGGFTKEAKYEADRANVALTLVDLPMLRDLLLEHYESTDTVTRQLVPLVRLYWPSSDA